VDVQPPNPILVSPPLQIKRQPSPDDPYNEEALLPAKQNIEILVEFPDGHVRELKHTALYVDGQIVDENTSELESTPGIFNRLICRAEVTGCKNQAHFFDVIPCIQAQALPGLSAGRSGWRVGAGGHSLRAVGGVLAETSCREPAQPVSAVRRKKTVSRSVVPRPAITTMLRRISCPC
jgi:hypothetical protein